MSDFVTRSSGNQQKFSSGAQRDTSSGKTRPDLISVKQLRRQGDLMARGAQHYGDRNWENGMPASRFLESLERHLLAYKEGERSEDHLAAICFNAGGIMHFEGTEWDDINEAPHAQEEATEYELPAGPMVNWTQLRLDVADGKLDGDTVCWPES